MMIIHIDNDYKENDAVSIVGNTSLQLHVETLNVWQEVNASALLWNSQ